MAIRSWRLYMLSPVCYCLVDGYLDTRGVEEAAS